MKSLLACFLLLVSFQSGTTVSQCDEMIKKGIDALYNKEHSKSLALFTKARKLSQENGWQKQEFISTNCIGLNFYQMLDYGEALDYYLQAYTIAIKASNSSQEMTVLNNIAVVYMQEAKYGESEKNQKRAFDLAVQLKDTIKIAMYAGNMATIYNETHKLDEATKYINLAKSKVPRNSREGLQIAVAEAENLILKKNYAQAQIVVRSFIDKIQATEFNDHKIAALIVLSKAERHNNNPDAALAITQKAKVQNLGYNNNQTIYEELSDIYFAKKEYDKSLAYKDSVMIVKDSLNAIKDQTLYQNSKIKLEIKDYQKELNISQNKLNSEKRIKYYLIGFTALVLMLSVWLLRSNYIKSRQKKIIAERTKKIIALEQLNKEKLQDELESKNRKLAANALHLASRNDKIEEFIASLNKEPELVKNTYLFRQINQLKNFLLKEDDREEFLTLFEEVNSRFLSVLKEKHPELNSNDIRFICYLYMNLTIKEICSLYNITPGACRKRKERIAHKIGIPESNDLYDYVSTL
jgi:tetratricopeptide (TPR) repeat protein